MIGIKKTILVFFLFPYTSFLSTTFAQQVRLGMPVGHSDEVTSAQFSPNGKQVVTASSDNTVRIWDVNSGKLLQSLKGHTNKVISAIFSPNGNYILSTSEDRTAKIWNATTGQLLLNIEGLSDYGCPAEFSSDGIFFVTNYDDNTVKIWETSSGRLMQTLVGHKNILTSNQFSHDGRYVLTTSFDNTAKIWDAKSGRLLHSLEGHTAVVNSAFFSFDGKYIVTSSDDNTSKIWEVTSGKYLYSLIGHADGVVSAQFSPDRKYIVTISKDNTAKKWDASNGKLLNNLWSDMYWVSSPPKFSPDGKNILLSSSSLGYNTAIILDVASGKLLHKFVGHFLMINSATFSPDGKYIVTSSVDQSAKIWDTNSDMILHNLGGQYMSLYSATISSNEKYIVSVSVYTAKIWESSSGKMINCLGGDTNLISTAEFSPDGNYLITGSLSGKTRIWDSKTLSIIHCLDGHTREITSAHFSSDGKYIVTASRDSIARVWDASSWKQICVLTGHTGEITSAQFSPNCKYIVTSGNDNIAKIWDAKNGKLLQNLLGHVDWLNSSQFNYDSKLVVTTSRDNTAKIWDTESGKLIHDLTGHKSWVNEAQFSPDGKKIVTVSIDRTAKIWDVESGNLFANLYGHSDRVWTAQFSPDGKNIITASDDGTAKIWDEINGKLIQTLEGHKGTVTSAIYNPDGKKIITASWDGNIIVWDALIQKEIVRMIALDDKEWLAVTSDKYYYGSKNATSQLYWIIDNNKVFTFDQFDLHYNRPDKVLEYIGLADTSLINAFRMAYLKRLKKMKFDEHMFSPDYHMPEIAILNRGDLPITTDKSVMTIKITAIDNKYKLDRINVFINDVPIFDMDGINLRTLNSNNIKKDINLELSQGENKIQVSCLNDKGAESYKESVYVKYQPKEPVTGKNYLVAISVSDYQESKYNLKYAVKDGKDMAKMFADKGFVVDTFFNSSVARDSILSLKQKLMQTKVDDQVIIYISGHGLLDKNYDFYFATYDMNFENPAEHGILYDDLEGLLDGIPARKKLLFMDACHSGEVDKEDICTSDSLLANNQVKGDLKVYKYKGTIIEGEVSSGLGLQNSFELMQELFANLSRGSGAVVISAASGVGYALESAEWNNGVFTYCILNGLKNLVADLNNDKIITVCELKEYISKEVEKLTNGKQKPTSRQENLSNDFEIWRN